MTVRYYIFGNEANQPPQSGSGGVPAEASYGPGEPAVGTLAAGETTITFTNATKRITIRNTHDALSLQYSLDGGGVGGTWQLLAPYGEISEPVNLSNLILRNFAAIGATYEVVGVLT